MQTIIGAALSVFAGLGIMTFIRFVFTAVTTGRKNFVNSLIKQAFDEKDWCVEDVKSPGFGTSSVKGPLKWAISMHASKIQRLQEEIDALKKTKSKDGSK